MKRQNGDKGYSDNYRTFLQAVLTLRLTYVTLKLPYERKKYEPLVL